ncbi:MAG: PEP-CTERM sorting domain-containing protein [Verrucomicrobia bacterium]|nr:PEP-CTERM sorting domain-containing protein [Verrucomicrobiota bacterium]
MKRSRILFIGVLAAVSLFPFHAFSAEVWAPGVSLRGGWYDFNKYSKGGTPSSNDSRMTDDGNMCWAASAANVIAWWQEQNKVTSEYTEMGRTIPQGKDVYQTFVGVFENVGGNPAPAFQWWVDGSAVPGTRTVFGDEGGPAWTGIDGKTYYPDFYYSGGLLTNSNYTSTPFYSISDNPVTIANSSSSNLTVQNKAIVDALSSGYALSLEVSTNDGSLPGHAITLWGVEYTEAANGDITLTKAYITDSDDYYSGIVSAGVDGKGYLYGMKIANLAYKITRADGLRTIAIPEPSAFGLLAGLGAFALVVSRRRRR